MRKLDLSHRAIRFLEGLPPKQFRQVVTTILRLLRDPFPHDSLALKGYPYHRVDIGEYRVIYRLEGDLVRVALIGKRNDDDVYRQVARL